MSRLIGTAVVVWMIAALAILSPPSVVKGQVPMTGAGLGAPSGGGATYTGPINVVSGPAVLWTLRAASAATRGNKLINLCDNAGANCADASSDATTGNLVVTSRGSDACATADDCLIHTFYDVSGATNCASAACDAIQTTAANMASLKHNCVNSTLFCAVFGGAASYSTSSGVASQAQPFTASTVTMYTSNSGANPIAQTNGAGQGEVGFHINSASVAGMYFGGAATAEATAAVNQWHSVQYIANNTSSSLYVDGTSTAPGTAVGTAAASGTLILGEGPFGQFYVGDFGEFGLWDSDFSASSFANAAAMCHNQFTYWATVTSC